MPSTSVTFQKSAKGAQALASRDPALTPKLRSLLILIDGKRGREDLEKVASALGDAGQLLAQLETLGFIEPSQQGSPKPAGAAAAPTQVAAPSASVASGHPPVPLKDAQRFAVRRLTDLLGPTAETLCLRIEGTHNAQEFMQAIHKAEMVLRDFGGQAMADAFVQEMQAHRPA
jgi:hypothetical protein